MNLFFFSLIILLCGSLAVLLLRKTSLLTLVGTSTTLLATSLSGYSALKVLLSGQSLSLSFPWPVPGAEFSLLLDPLAAFFVLPISLLSLFCALYAGPYMAHDGHTRSLIPHWFFFNLMVLAMLLVVTASNAVLFLAVWEIMTISSFFLVAWDHHREDVRKAAWLYLLAAHLGMVLLMALFIFAGSYCDGFNFSDFAQLANLPFGSASLIYLLALFGFGTKAGLFPLHIWLPNAHPAAPSHVSALMSGVLIKTGLYGILRIITFLPPAPAWWGWLMVILGATGALYGISLAIQQRDIKRCLAYSTVENVGIMFLGFGFGMVATATGHPTIALLSYAGGMLHLWNHALFKGVMFLGAGILAHATGTRDMNRMGGLLRRMPLTGLLWIGGSLAIGALPPFNGLISEWLIYLGLAQAGMTLEGYVALAPLILFGLLGLVGALALVTFTRLIGICLLGEPRSSVAADAHDAAPAMLISMGVLLTGCLLIGIYPQGALQLLSTPLVQISHLPVGENLVHQVIPLGQWGLLLLAAVVALGGLFFWLRHLRPLVQGATWGCGYRFPTVRMSYTGAGYAELASRHLLPEIMRPQVRGGRVDGIFPAPAARTQQSTDPVLIKFLHPLFEFLAESCLWLHRLQHGKMPIYLVYIFATSVVLMGWSLWVGGHGGG